MKNYLKEGYKEDIIIKADDVDQLEVGEIFLDKLWEMNKEFVKKVEKKEAEFQDFLNLKKDKRNENILFTPEVLSKRSPMTVIDAKWGSGKTYFVETLLENMALGKFKNKHFKNAILIDAWKTSISKDAISELFAQLFEKLIKIYPKNKKDSIKEFAIQTYDIGSTIFKTRLGYEKADEKMKNKYEIAINNLKTSKSTTLIFIDNIERVGRDAWDILKGISKLLILKGFVIVLPINLEKMHKAYEEEPIDQTQKNSSTENSIEKYLDMKFFQFKQDYKGLLLKQGFSEEESDYFNSVLETKNEENKILSVREVENRIVGSEIIKQTSENNRKILFQECIWKSNDIFKQSIVDPCKNIIELFNTWYSDLNKMIRDMEFDTNHNISNNLSEKIEEFNNNLPLLKVNNVKNNIRILKERFKKYEKLIDEINNYNLKIENKIKELEDKKTIISANALVFKEKVKYSSELIDEIKEKLKILKNENESLLGKDECYSKGDNTYEYDDLLNKCKKKYDKNEYEMNLLETKNDSETKILQDNNNEFDKSTREENNMDLMIKNHQKLFLNTENQTSRDFIDNEINKIEKQYIKLEGEKIAEWVISRDIQDGEEMDSGYYQRMIGEFL